MTREEFKKPIQLIIDAYGSKFPVNQSVFNVWYDHLGKPYNQAALIRAVDSHIDNSAFPPTIHDLKKLIDDKRLEIASENEYIQTNWQHIVDSRPTGEDTEEAHKYFMEYLSTFEDRLKQARQVYKWVSEYTGEKTLRELMQILCEKSKNQ